MITETAVLDAAYANDPGFVLTMHEVERLKGEAIAIRRCGELPISVTLSDFQRAIARAAIVSDFAISLWGRWAHRTHPIPEGERLERGSIRLNAMHEVAKEICFARSARFQTMNEPEGSA